MSEQIKGGYRFLPGISPYSCGVAAISGYEIVHVTLSRLVPYREGFEIVARYLDDRGRPRQALCAMELRSPESFSMDGFIQFNQGYRAILEEWDLLVDGINPVARTNVAPAVAPPAEPSLHAFSYTEPVNGRSSGLTFVVAGAGEVREGRLEADAIVRRGETSLDAITEKAAYVLERMSERRLGLGASWEEVTAVDVYTVHDIFPLLQSQLIPATPAAARHGVRWHLTRPPIVDVEFEMDLRGVRVEQVLAV
jgi:hypothetical protein